MELLLKDLAKILNLTVYGNSEIVIENVNALEQANNKQISFLSNKKYLSQVQYSKAGALVISKVDLAYFLENYPHIKLNAIISPNPYATFARIFQYFHPVNLLSINNSVQQGNIHSSTSIHTSAKISKNAVIGAFCSIEANVIIEDNVIIGSNCNIGANSHIKNNTKLYANVSIYHNCIIGSDNIIHSGAVIGSDGFGFAPDLKVMPPEQPEWIKIPQIGNVITENNVEIGANTTIDRATFGTTTIGLGSKIDNQVQIAHNVIIGKHCVIAGCTAIAGSTKIGDFCIIGGSSQIAGHLNIANGAIISGGTSIMQSTTKAVHLTGLFPAMEHKIWEKNAALLRQLQNLRKQIKNLEKHIKT